MSYRQLLAAYSLVGQPEATNSVGASGQPHLIYTQTAVDKTTGREYIVSWLPTPGWLLAGDPDESGACNWEDYVILKIDPPCDCLECWRKEQINLENE